METIKPAVNHLQPKGEIGTRYSIEELQEDPFAWSLFIQAYSAMQQQTNPYTKEDQTQDPSYFGNIAGIHGLPNRPYPGEKTKPSWGYCHHGLPTFPTWHRAYVKTIEQSLKYYSDLIISKYTQVPDDVMKQLKDANTKLRFPYLDWDNLDTSHIITPIINSETLTLAYALPHATSQNVRNPLKCFVNSEDYGDVLQGTFNNPASRPRYSPPLSTPFTPKGFPTIRHPTDEYLDDIHRMNLVGLEYHANTLVPGMYQMFQNDDYYLWSNHSVTRKQDHPEGYGLYSSLEVYHDSIHDAIGGNGGHMSFPPVAAFDPFFFLHHCNVDRLFALWQRCYPDKWFNNPELYELGDNYVPPDGGLNPFYSNATDKYVTSDELRSYQDWGYNYSGAFFDPKYDGHPNTLLADVLKYYGTNLELPYSYSVDIDKIDKNKYPGPYTIRVFIGNQNVDQNTPTSSKYYVGCVSTFARGNATTCENCEGAQIKGHLLLNNTLLKLNYDITVEDGQDLVEQSQLSTQVSSFRDEIVLVAVDKNNNLLYKWTASGNMTTPTVTVNYQKNFVSDSVQNELVNLIKDLFKENKYNFKIEIGKLISMSGRQIINYIKKNHKDVHEELLKKFFNSLKVIRKKVEE